MGYRNSVKVFFSNFNIVWKLALYFLVIMVVCGVLLFAFLNPVFKMIREAGFFAELLDLYSDFLSNLNLAVAMERLSVVLENAFDFFVSNIGNIWWNVLGVVFVLFFLSSVLYELSNMAICKSLHFYIGSLTRQGYFASFSDAFGKNLKVSLCKYFVSLPINALYVYLFVLSLKLFGIHWLLNIIAVFIIVIGIVLLLAFKWSLFVLWTPTMVVMNYGVWKSFRVALKNVFKRFGKVYSNAVGMVLTVIIINMSFGLFTFMAGLIISVPISFLLYNSLGMVFAYEVQGMRYYVDIYNVVTPNKKEISDKLKDMKFIV